MSKHRDYPCWIKRYLEWTSCTEPARIYHTWTAISTIASVLQRKCSLQWGRDILYPNFYIILVGVPAARKGTAIKCARPFLDQLGISLCADAITREGLIEVMSATGETQTPNDDVIKLAYHSSLTCVSDEFGVLIGRDEQSKRLIQALCAWYDCQDVWTYYTKSRQEETIRGVWFNLLAATTPAAIAVNLPASDAIGTGLTSRCIFVYADTVEHFVSSSKLPEGDTELESSLLHDLNHIQTIEGPFAHTDMVEDLYQVWYDDTCKNPPFEDLSLLGYNGRRATHFRKLWMICSAARTDSRIIEVQDYQAALGFLTAAEATMRRTFQGMGKSPLNTAIANIKAMVAMRGTCTTGDVLKVCFQDVTLKELDEAVAVLQQAKEIEVVYGLVTTLRQVGYEGKKRDRLEKKAT